MKKLFFLVFIAMIITSACKKRAGYNEPQKTQIDSATSSVIDEIDRKLSEKRKNQNYAVRVNDSISYLALMLHLGEADSSTPGIDGKGEGLMNIVQKNYDWLSFLQYKTKAVASALTPEDAKSEKKLLAAFERCQPYWFGCDYEYLWQVVYKVQDNEGMYTRYTLDSLAEQNHLQDFLEHYKKTVDAVSGKWKGHTKDTPSRKHWKLIRAKVEKSYQALKDKALKNDVGLSKEDLEKLSMNWEQAYLIVREKKFKN